MMAWWSDIAGMISMILEMTLEAECVISRSRVWPRSCVGKYPK